MLGYLYRCLYFDLGLTFRSRGDKGVTSQDFRHPPDSRFPSDSPIRLPFSLDPCFSWVTATFFSVDLSGPPTSRPLGYNFFLS